MVRAAASSRETMNRPVFVIAMLTDVESQEMVELRALEETTSIKSNPVSEASASWWKQLVGRASCCFNNPDEVCRGLEDEMMPMRVKWIKDMPKYRFMHKHTLQAADYLDFRANMHLRDGSYGPYLLPMTQQQEMYPNFDKHTLAFLKARQDGDDMCNAYANWREATLLNLAELVDRRPDLQAQDETVIRKVIQVVDSTPNVGDNDALENLKEWFKRLHSAEESVSDADGLELIRSALPISFDGDVPTEVDEFVCSVAAAQLEHDPRNYMSPATIGTLEQVVSTFGADFDTLRSFALAMLGAELYVHATTRQYIGNVLASNFVVTGEHGFIMVNKIGAGNTRYPVKLQPSAKLTDPWLRESFAMGCSLIQFLESLPRRNKQYTQLRDYADKLYAGEYEHLRACLKDPIFKGWWKDWVTPATSKLLKTARLKGNIDDNLRLAPAKLREAHSYSFMPDACQSE